MRKRKKLIRACTVADSVFFIKDIMGELTREYNVVVLSSEGKDLRLLEEEWKDAVDEEGNRLVRCMTVEMNRRISIWQDVRSVVGLIKVFRREKPDMVHSITPKAGLLCMVAASVTRVPVRIHNFTGLIWPTSRGVKRWLLMATDMITCRCATHIIPEGEGVMNDLRKITDKDMKVLGYGNVRGVDMEYYSRRPEIMEMAYDLKREGVFTFLFVGRLMRDKGIEELVEAFERLYSDNDKCRLVLVGYYEENGNEISDETAQKMKSCGGIEYVGRKRDDDLLAYYAMADCFVFPSYREGMPNVVLEAGAMGLPSIVTDTNGSREIIIEGENGVIVPPMDAEMLYAAMERMMSEQEWRVKMAGNARRMIGERFEQRYVCDCLMDYYRGLGTKD